MSWIEPIFDRTSQDVINVKALIRVIQSDGWDSLTEEDKNTFLGELRGTFSSTTFNRIIENTYSLKEYLLSCGYKPEGLNDVPIGWTDSDIIDIYTLVWVVDNIQLLIECFYEVEDQLPTDLLVLDFEKVNAIEKVEWDIKYWLDKIKEHKLYCGQPSCGQTVIGGLLYAG